MQYSRDVIFHCLTFILRNTFQIFLVITVICSSFLFQISGFQNFYHNEEKRNTVSITTPPTQESGLPLTTRKRESILFLKLLSSDYLLNNKAFYFIIQAIIPLCRRNMILDTNFLYEKEWYQSGFSSDVLISPSKNTRGSPLALEL